MTDDLLMAINDVIDFAKHKTSFEVQQRINLELKKMRSADFAANSSRFSSVTRDLAKTKIKIERFKKRVSELSSEYQTILAPLIKETEDRVIALRQVR